MNRRMYWFFFGLYVAGLVCGGALFVFAKQPVAQWEKRIGLSEFHCNATFCETGEIAIPLDAQTLGLSVQHGDVLEVRMRDQKGWTGWMRVEGETDAPDFDNDGRPYALYLSRSIRAVRLRAPLREPHEVSVVALSLPPDSAIQGGVTMAVSGEEQSVSGGIIPRASWLVSSGALSEKEQHTLWSPQYSQPKKFVIHHTATIVRDMNGDAAVDRADYQDAVRAIYSFHARSRRWGDVGYNYIISPDGTVWEGRSGGDGIVAGHTVRSASCTKFTKPGIGFNDGSIGIALLGTYTNEGVSFAAVSALVELIAQKSWEFGIEPAGLEFFKDAVYPNVVGHRDLDCTSCPGESMNLVLSDIVRMAQGNYEKLVEIKPRQYKAEFVDAVPQRVMFAPGEKEKEVLVRFKNTGTISWRSYGDENLRIARADITKVLSARDAVRMATVEDQKDESVDVADEKKAPSAYMVATLLAPNVSPGQIGAFRLRLTPPDQFMRTEKFVLATGDRGWLSGTELVIEAVNGNRPRAALLENKAPRLLTDEGEATVSLEFRNMGTEPWKRNEVTLLLSGADSFRTKKWKKRDGQFLFDESAVAPGEVAHIRVLLHADKPGRGELKPVLVWKKEKIEGSDLTSVPLVIAPSRIVAIDMSLIPRAVLMTWRPIFSVRVENTGEKPLKNISLIAHDSEKKSVWFHPSWKNKTTIDMIKEIKPRERATILFRVTPPQKIGRYELKLLVHVDGKRAYIGTIDNYRIDGIRSIRVDKQ